MSNLKNGRIKMKINGEWYMKFDRIEIMGGILDKVELKVGKELEREIKVE